MVSGQTSTNAEIKNNALAATTGTSIRVHGSFLTGQNTLSCNRRSLYRTRRFGPDRLRCTESRRMQGRYMDLSIFPERCFSRQAPPGPDLLLRHLRGEQIDWGSMEKRCRKRKPDCASETEETSDDEWQAQCDARRSSKKRRMAPRRRARTDKRRPRARQTSSQDLQCADCHKGDGEVCFAIRERRKGQSALCLGCRRKRKTEAMTRTNAGINLVMKCAACLQPKARRDLTRQRYSKELLCSGCKHLEYCSGCEGFVAKSNFRRSGTEERMRKNVATRRICRHCERTRNANMT